MAQELDKLIYSLTSNKSTPNIVNRTFDAFKLNSEVYFKGHDALIKGSREGSVRLSVSKVAPALVDQLKTEYNNARREISKYPYTFLNDKKVKYGFDRASENVLNAKEAVFNKYGIKVDVKEADLKADYEKNKNAAKQLNKLVDAILKVNKDYLARIEKDPKEWLNISYKSKAIDNLISESTRGMSVEDQARNYVTKKYLANGINKETSAEDIRKFRKAVESGDYKKEIDKLANNKVFQDVMKKNGKEVYKAWNAVEKKADALQTYYKQMFSDFKTNGNGKISTYIISDPSQIGTKDADILNDQYVRLAKVAVVQMYHDNRATIEGIAAGSVKENDLIEKTLNFVKERKLLEGENATIAKLNKLVDGGTLKKMINDAAKTQKKVTNDKKNKKNIKL